jgi:hypothetical protein
MVKVANIDCLDHFFWPYGLHSTLPSAGLGHNWKMATLGNPYLSLGLMATRAPWPRFFRYCASCVECDRQSLQAETYWHRLHQIPGIEVCGIHRERLRNSNLEFRQPRNRFEYVSAESAGVLQINSQGSERIYLLTKPKFAWRKMLTG